MVLAHARGPPRLAGRAADVRTHLQRLARLQHGAVTLTALRGHNKTAIALANELARIIWEQ